MVYEHVHVLATLSHDRDIEHACVVHVDYKVWYNTERYRLLCVALLAAVARVTLQSQSVANMALYWLL